MIERVDLGPCTAYDYAGDGPTAVVLPGAMLGGMPAVWFAFAPLLEDGWRVVLAWWEFLDRSLDHWAWVRERADAALAYAGGADLLIAKSLGCFAAPIDLPAVWLTPLLVDGNLVEAMRARTQSSLLVGGTADSAWVVDVARSLGDVLELEGVDHGLARTSDADAIGAAVQSFSGRLQL